MKSKLLGLIAGVALLGVSPASAVTITTFDVSGEFAPGTLGGTINIDVTGNTVSSASVRVTGTSPAVTGPFTIIDNLVEYPHNPLLYIALSDAGADTLVLFLPTSTLTGYPGGMICSTTYSCSLTAQAYLNPGGTQIFEILTSGSLTATPLPAALPLFATGLGALGLLGWHTKRKAQAAA
jgi:hypothetical protein